MAKKKSKQKYQGSNQQNPPPKPKVSTLTRNEETERKFAEETVTLKDEPEKVKCLTEKKNDLLEKNIEDMVQDVGTLRSKIETNKKELKDMHKKILDILAEKVTGENENSDLQEDVSDLWTAVNMLIDRLHNSLLEEKGSFNDLRAKMESTTISHGKVLALLSNTASLLCQSPIAEKKPEEETEPISTELEALKQAFKKKHTLIQDLKQKVEVMEENIDESQKENSLRKEMITVIEENERKLAEEMVKLLEERESARIVMEMNKKELKDMKKKILNFLEEFLGDKGTGESENSEKQDVSVLWIVVNRLIDRLQISLLEARNKKIQQAFENEETVTQGLKLKAEAMEKTIVESQKKNSFWKSVSLATTIMAAVTFAYAAKRRWRI
ncbi:polyamine-modulated factor 1-binding protein 1-like [Hibiscus syriacus]|uniref:polyamine-modulated factor 1-binding protein 1-like n=1 Tax=Hibiscus syriacus TaxID=106335 RepID=UPI001921AEA8|nr:polyamine-modulated factor 1-binding protein 1-like [Hibiscus syriacus]